MATSSAIALGVVGSTVLVVIGRVIIVLAIDCTHVIVAIVTSIVYRQLVIINRGLHVLVVLVLQGTHFLVEQGLHLKHFIVIDVFLKINILSPLEELKRNKLNDGTDDQRADSQGPRDNILLERDGRNLQNGLTQLVVWSHVDHVVLQAHLEESNQPEQRVVEKGPEDVLVVFVD